MNLPKIILKPGKENALRRFHPWVFSGAVGNVEGDLQPGDIVEVRSHRNQYLATGHYTSENITVKIFDFTGATVTDLFWHRKIESAFELRKRIGLTDSALTNGYRLVHSEGDGMPGLVIDYYNGVAVVQCHSAGMHRIFETIRQGLEKVYGKDLHFVYDKSDETLPGQPPVMSLTPAPTPHIFLETGHQFLVDIEKGQKTGFFLDQRSNRMFSQFFARERKILNAFCYSGAFSVYCLKGGASEVHSLDSSRQALEWTNENLRLNGLSDAKHSVIHADAKKYLAEESEKYDMIILDPPAFAKSHQVSNNALHAYIHINRAALNRLNPGGLLMTFSCSQAISRDMFRSALQSAAIEAGRPVRLLHHLGQGPDHPVSIFHPEGEYLKGLVLMC